MLGVAALWKAQRVRGLPVTAVKHGTKAGLSKDSDKVNHNEEKNKACLLLSHQRQWKLPKMGCCCC